MTPGSALDAFSKRLGYVFAEPDLLTHALTHRSWCAEHPSSGSNERLEFLGDSVLGLIVTDEVFRRFPEAEEGLLSRLRASVVRAAALAEIAAELDVGEVLLLGKGENTSGGRGRPSILADAMEALIGAVYLDGGILAARELVLRLVDRRLEGGGGQDPKSQLHELVAHLDVGELSYDITEAGPEHDKYFRAVVMIDAEAYGAGAGRSKKQAEQAAARVAWLRLSTQHDADQPVRRAERVSNDG